ncbi:MAG: transposase domain-containing protein [Pseudomonadota bacterium]
MPASAPLSQEWFTAKELAESGLPGVPTSTRGVNAWATSIAAADKVRGRDGKGGGREFHYSALPLPAQRALMATVSDITPEQEARAALWRAYDALPEGSRAKAAERLKAVENVHRLATSGLKKDVAVRETAAVMGASTRSIWAWLALVEKRDRRDWLAALAPKRRGPAPTAPEEQTEGDTFMGVFKSLALRLGEPSFRDCHRKTCLIAKKRGWPEISYQKALRQLRRDVPMELEVFKRRGWQALQTLYPSQIRDRSGFEAMEAVNADCHKIDVFVRWPDGTVNRPQIVAFQDLYSGKILSWRVDFTPNKVMVMAAFGEMVDLYGIPRHCTFDNGMEFASKDLTGGAKTRYRFKVREDEPLGILPMFGIEMHWATPGHGQAKPIERTFRDFAYDIARDVRFQGAYVGNKPTAKPENYGERAVPFEEFMAVLAEGIDEMNARPGRQSRVCQGRSFDDAFAASYATAQIMKATAEQRRLWLMGHAVVTVHADQARIMLHKNEYFSPWLVNYAGQKLVARFDPEDLHAGLYLYGKDGAYLGEVDCRQAIGFYDMAGARAAGKQRSDLRKAMKAMEAAQVPHAVKDLAGMLRESAPEEPARAALEARVVALPTPKAPMPRRAAPEPVADAAIEARRETLIVSLSARKGEDTPDEPEGAALFWRAQEIEQRQAEGLAVGSADATWLAGYQRTPQYKQQLAAFTRFGAEGVR